LFFETHEWCPLMTQDLVINNDVGIFFTKDKNCANVWGQTLTELVRHQLSRMFEQ